MSDFEFPELPSDDDLGITDEDREQLEKDFPGDGPEMSDAELAALLGEASPSRSPTPPVAPEGAAKPKEATTGKSAKGTPDAAKVREEASKEVRKAEKKQSKDEAKAARETARHAKAEAKARAKREKTDARQARAEERKKASKEEVAVPAWRGPVTLAILILFAVFSSSRTGLPRPGPANAPDTAFSSARAMVTLVDLAREAPASKLLLVNGDEEQEIECLDRSGFPFFGQLILDCINRTEHAMSQRHAFKAAELPSSATTAMPGVWILRDAISTGLTLARTTRSIRDPI